MNTLNQSAQTNRLRLHAEHLLMLSQEQVYALAQNQFPTMDSCNFQPGSNCGMPNILNIFPDITPHLDFIKQNTTNLKQPHIWLTWNEEGFPEQLDASAFYSTPKAPLPSNIMGEVQDTVTNKIVSGVTLTAQNTPGANNATTTSTSTVTTADNEQINYTFADPSTAQFILPSTGTWQVTATRSGYTTFTSKTFSIQGTVPYVLPIPLTPLPVDAQINVSLVNANDSTPATFNSNSQIDLYQGGALKQTVSAGSGTSFNIPFTDTDQQCFTVATRNAWRSDLAGNFSCSGFNYQADGWSSAVASAGASCSTSNWSGGGNGVFNGTASTLDTICVNSGDTQNVTVPLVPVPQTTISGSIADASVDPIANEPLTITVDWHNGTLWGSEKITTNNSNDTYSIQAPAEQEMFPNTSNYYAQLKFQYNVPQLHCCNQQASETIPGDNPVGPLLIGVFPHDLSINTTSASPLTCGNAAGNIIDASNRSDIVGATVKLTTSAGINQTTDSSGNYIYQCPANETGYLVPTGTATLTVNQGNYYAFSSTGNSFYAGVPIPAVTATSTDPLPKISLWPLEFGTISGTVTDLGSGLPIPNEIVKIKPDNNVLLANDPAAFIDTDKVETLEAITDSGGNFSFPNVPITWPPSILAGNPYYNQISLEYTLTVLQSQLYPAYSSGRFVFDQGGKNFIIQLESKGEM